MLNVNQDKLEMNYLALFTSPLLFASIVVIWMAMKIYIH